MSLRDLVSSFSSKPGVAKALNAKLDAAAAAKTAHLRDMILGVFINQVNAQRGKSFTREEADLLILLTQALMSDWDFEFLPPVDEGALNRARAGQIFPIKFSLGAYYGLDILQSGYPQSIQVVCSTYEPIGEPQPTHSKFGLWSIGGKYYYNWNTDKSWKGTCRQLIFGLKDNSVHSALFLFK